MATSPVTEEQAAANTREFERKLREGSNPMEVVDFVRDAASKGVEFLRDAAMGAADEDASKSIPQQWLDEIASARIQYENSRDFKTEKEAKDAGVFDEDWIKGLAEGDDHRLVVDLKKGTVRYMPKKQANKLEDNDDYYVCDTTGEVIQLIGNAYDVEPRSVAKAVAGKLGMDYYPSQTLGIGTGVAAGIVAPRSSRMMFDDEAESRLGGKGAAIVGDVAEDAASFFPLAGPSGKLVRAGLKAGEGLKKAEKFAKIAGGIRKAYDTARLAKEGNVAARAGRGAVSNAIDNEIIDALSGAYDAVTGTRRGYENEASDDVVAGIGGAITGALKGPSVEFDVKKQIFDRAKNKGLLNRLGWKSDLDVPDDYVQFYKGNTQGNDFFNKPMKPYNELRLRSTVTEPDFYTHALDSEGFDIENAKKYYKALGFNSPEELLQSPERKNFMRMLRQTSNPTSTPSMTVFNPDWNPTSEEAHIMAAGFDQNARNNPLASPDRALATSIRRFMLPDLPESEMKKYKKASEETALRHDVESMRGKYKEKKRGPVKSALIYIPSAASKNLGKYDKSSFLRSAMGWGDEPLENSYEVTDWRIPKSGNN